MNEFLHVLLQIVQFTVPAIIVFITIYFLSKQFFKNQETLAALKNRKGSVDATRLIKLQSFERLTLFCERIDLSNLAGRIVNRGMSSKELEQSMLITVQSEYEHNLAQQIYVSEKLWQIIVLCKTETNAIIRRSAKSLPADATAYDLLAKIAETVEEIKMNPSDQARRALRSEASLLLN